jgi:hypothetical protein
MTDLTVDGLVEAARAETGLDTFHSESWREGLDILLKDHATTGLLNEAGRGWRRHLFVMSLTNRLRIDDYIRRHPEITEAPIKRPVFILGMPRTGTTLLSYLLGADPARRSLLKWEAFSMVPPAEPGALKTDPRCLAGLAQDVEALKRDPGMAQRHYETADGPTECVFTMAQDFKSLMLEVMSSAPTYGDWILFNDMTSAFEHRKRVLQVLQSTNPGLWTLKMPSDSLFIRTLFKTFPDARVIWTHRDPYVATSSIFSLRHYSRSNFNSDPDLPYMRARYPFQMAQHLMRPLEFAQERPDAIYNLYYDDMTGDPMGQMRKLYAWLGDDLSPTAEAGMQAWLAANPQGRFGAHGHSLEKWGLSEEALEPYFADYLKAHPVTQKASA